MPPILTSDFVADYRNFSDAIAAGVAVLTVGQERRLTGVTIDSYMDVSWDPPTMLVSVLTLSRIMEVLDSADVFTISVLNARQRDIATWLGTSGQPNYGLLDGIPLVEGIKGPAHIADCVAFFEVETTDRHEVATHTLLSGPVVTQGGDTGTKPLIRVNREYGTFGEL